MLTIKLYKKEGCSGCEAAEAMLKGVPVDIKVYDVEKLHRLKSMDEATDVLVWLA